MRNSVAKGTVDGLDDVDSSGAAEGLRGTLPAFAGQVINAVHRWSSTARSAAISADGRVRANPWAAIGVVALVGAAAGILTARTIRRARRPSISDHDSASEWAGG